MVFHVSCLLTLKIFLNENTISCDQIFIALQIVLLSSFLSAMPWLSILQKCKQNIMLPRVKQTQVPRINNPGRKVHVMGRDEEEFGFRVKV